MKFMVMRKDQLNRIQEFVTFLENHALEKE